MLIQFYSNSTLRKQPDYQENIFITLRIVSNKDKINLDSLLSLKNILYCQVNPWEITSMENSLK